MRAPDDAVIGGHTVGAIQQQWEATHVSVNATDNESSSGHSPPIRVKRENTNGGNCALDSATISKRKRETKAIITIGVKDESGVITHFIVRRATPMRRVLFAYKKRAGVQDVNFVFDGDRVSGEATSETLGMEDGDQLYVMAEQTGD
jgi:small ubiquitin-related modifier